MIDPTALCQFPSEAGISICGRKGVAFVDDHGRPLCLDHGPRCTSCPDAGTELDLRDGRRYCRAHVPQERATVSPADWSALCEVSLARPR
jgi:hypothetical protein